MKCLVIHGSPRRGNTWDVLNRVKEEMNKNGNFQWDIIELGRLQMTNCVGCFNCIFKGEEQCPHNNYMGEIRGKMDEADVFIITSSVYSLNITGTLKTFIDHMSFKFHRPSYFTKKALVITTTAGAGHEDAAKYIKNVLGYWGVNYIKTVAIAYRAAELSEKNIGIIRRGAKDFAKELNYGEIHKAKIKSVCMFNVWKAMSLAQDDKENADYKYWSNPKLENKIYDCDVPIGITGKVIGNIAFKIMKK